MHTTITDQQMHLLIHIRNDGEDRQISMLAKITCHPIIYVEIQAVNVPRI